MKLGRISIFSFLTSESAQYRENFFFLLSSELSKISKILKIKSIKEIMFVIRLFFKLSWKKNEKKTKEKYREHFCGGGILDTGKWILDPTLLVNNNQ
jgi:hypothetical protein